MAPASFDQNLIEDNVAYTRAQDVTPQLSIVVACYNVGPYLERFFSSIEQQQEFDLGAIEIIFVVDGSPDDSEEIIRRLALNSSIAVRTLVRENGGVSAARNSGLELARGNWVTFPDPDDSFSANYFAEVWRSMSRSPNVSMFATRLVRVSSEGASKSHSLDFKFGNAEFGTISNLLDQPENVLLHSATVFYSLSNILRNRLRFDERLRRGFEDAHFIGRYFQSVEPRYGLVSSAHYYYFERDDSIIAQGGQDYSKYIDVIRYGYNDLLDHVPADEDTPLWLGSLILYDLVWLFRGYFQMGAPVLTLPDEIHKLLSNLVKETIARVGIESVLTYRVTGETLNIRKAWEVGALGQVHSHLFVAWDFDARQSLRRIVVHDANQEVSLSVTVDGVEVTPLHQHAREIRPFNETWVYEHSVWVPVQGLDSVITASVVDSTRDSVLSGEVISDVRAREELGIRPTPAGAKVKGPGKAAERAVTKRISANRREWKKLRLRLSFAYRLGLLLRWNKKYRDAWVFIDRDNQANDNAEALYKYVSERRKDVNAWFVIKRDSSDYARLKSEGVRLVPHGSRRHFVLMKYAKVLASSMGEVGVYRPFPMRFLEPNWLYVFLQHGVTQSDLHRWLNGKPIDVFVTATKPEFESIAGDVSRYKFSTKETILTGFPRQDRLFRLKQEQLHRGKKRLIIMPTWRQYLLENSGERRRIDDFLLSDYVRSWQSFLLNEDLKKLIEEQEVEIYLLMHPNVDKYWPELIVADGIKRISYLGDDVQRVFAGVDLVVTDFSSQAFEGAFLDAPTVYYQFDRKDFHSGKHTLSAGYFDYDQDGFGPVTESETVLLQKINEMLVHSEPNFKEYQRRIAGLYAHKDGNASERVVREIEKRLHP